MWACARRNGPAPQESTLPLTKALLPWGCRGLRLGSCTLPLAVHMSLHCLWQSKFNLACLLQNSTGIPAPFETFLWLALRRGPIFGAVGLHAFCLPSLRTLHVCMYVCMYVYIYIHKVLNPRLPQEAAGESLVMSMNLQFQIRWFLFWIQSDFYWRLKLVKIKIANFNFNLSCL